MKDRLAILMSTYNGEDYLYEQIKSIQNQSHTEWKLYIRDDGSKDNTVDIIKSFANSDQRIIFFNENKIKNRGVAKSFMTLLKDVDADYYMFADQDDYWKSDKIIKTLNAMKINEGDYGNIPICVHTNLTIVDKTLTGNTLMIDHEWSTFKELLFANCVTGCTMMINSVVKSLIDFTKLQSTDIYLHDWWLALIAAAFGKVVYLDQSTILYRQHSGNVIGSDKPGTIWQSKNRENSNNERVLQTVKMAYSFWNNYQNMLKGSNKKYVQEYAKLVNRHNPFFSLWVVCSCPPKRQTFKGSIFFGYLTIKKFRSFQRLS